MRLEGKQRRKDGTTFAVEIEASRIDQEGHPLVLTLVRNVDERKQADTQIKRAKEFAEKVINTSPGITFIVDLKTTAIQFVNQQTEEVLGYSIQELQQGGLEFIRELLHPEDVEPFVERVARWNTIENDELMHVELRVKDASGNWRWFEIRETVFQRDEDDQVLQVIGTAVDVTDRVEAERALRESQERYDTAIRYARQGVWNWDVQTHEVYWSDSLFQLLGMEPGSEIPTQQRFQKLLHPSDRKHFQAEFRKFLASGNSIEFDARIWHQSEEYRWFRISGDGEYDPQDRLWKMAGTLADVHAERIAKQALSDREAQYRAVFEAAANGFLIYTLDGKLVEVNPAACQMRGYTREELLSLDPKQFVHPDSYPIFREFLETIRRGERFDGQAVGLRKDGSKFEVIIVGVPYQVGDQVMALASVIDITERQRAEAERESLIQRLEAINNELQQFTYTVSHDLKSPLITIKGFIGVLAEDLARADLKAAREDMAIIDDAADKMKQLLDDLLELSRIGRVVNTYSEVSLSDVVEEVTLLLAGEIEQRQAQLDVDIQCGNIQGDRIRLRQVIQNLLDNAIKHGSKEQPRVRIYGRDIENGVRLWIEDNGGGVPSRFHDKIFGLFEKLEPDSEGSGIGLAICKRIVEHHGGRIGIDEESGLGGCRLYVELPCNPSTPLASASSQPDHPAASGPSSSLT